MLKWVAMPFSRGIFPTQGSNPGLPHCRQILSHHITFRGNIIQLILPLSSTQNLRFHLQVPQFQPLSLKLTQNPPTRITVSCRCLCSPHCKAARYVASTFSYQVRGAGCVRGAPLLSARERRTESSRKHTQRRLKPPLGRPWLLPPLPESSHSCGRGQPLLQQSGGMRCNLT